METDWCQVNPFIGTVTKTIVFVFLKQEEQQVRAQHTNIFAISPYEENKKAKSHLDSKIYISVILITDLTMFEKQRADRFIIIVLAVDLCKSE